MRHTYRIDQDKGIVFQIYHGKMTFQKIMEAMSVLSSDPLYFKEYAFFTDLRKAELMLEDSILTKIGSATKIILGDQKVKSALLIGDMIEMSLAVLFKEILSDFREVGIFTTYEAAMEWLEEHH